LAASKFSTAGVARARAGATRGIEMDNTTYAASPTALTCWKDIARYFGKGVRTVQRWEQEFGLPVRRAPAGFRHSSVAADVDELNAWFQSRWTIRPVNESGRGADHAPLTEDRIRNCETR
jgi:hypothetical protein